MGVRGLLGGLYFVNRRAGSISHQVNTSLLNCLSPYSTALNTGFETFSEPKIAVFEQKMIVSKKDDPVLKRSNKIRRGVENRLSNSISAKLLSVLKQADGYNSKRRSVDAELNSQD